MCLHPLLALSARRIAQELNIYGIAVLIPRKYAAGRKELNQAVKSSKQSHYANKIYCFAFCIHETKGAKK